MNFSYTQTFYINRDYVSEFFSSKNDVRKDIQKIKVPNWKTLAQDTRRWKELVEKAKSL